MLVPDLGATSGADAAHVGREAGRAAIGAGFPRLREGPAEKGELDEGDGEEQGGPAIGFHGVAPEAGDEVHGGQAKNPEQRSAALTSPSTSPTTSTSTITSTSTKDRPPGLFC